MGQSCRLNLEIRHRWDGKILSLPSPKVITASDESLTLTRLSYLLSLPRLQSADGSWKQRADWFAFVDASRGTTSVSLAGIPPGSYQALQFHIGLPEETNQADPNQYGSRHPLNPVVNNLHWDPQGGYIFLALEGLHWPSPGGAPQGFSYHLGNAPNLMTIHLPYALEISSNLTLTIDFDLDRIFNPEPALEVATQSSTHARPGDLLAPFLKQRIENALTLASVRSEAGEGKAFPLSPPKQDKSPLVGTPAPLSIPAHLPVPALPRDFPLTRERIELGKKLFHDPLLSRDESISCASCHQHSHALTDPRRFSPGISGQPGTRNSMPLFNLAWKSSFFWDGRAPSLREQVLHPIRDPVEMGNTLDVLTRDLESDPEYASSFAKAFGDSSVTPERVAISLEQFLLTLTSFTSRFDQAVAGLVELTPEEKRGFELFMTEYDPRRGQFGADCFHCHGGALFTDHRFHNNGLKPGSDPGREAFTGSPSDQFRFSTPSLRNIELTAPYMHDGRFLTLEAVISHYNGPMHRTETLAPNLAKHPTEGINLSPADQAALLAFLRTLTDPQFTSP